MFHLGIFAVHNPCPLAALALDDLWNGKLNSFLSFELERIP